MKFIRMPNELYDKFLRIDAIYSEKTISGVQAKQKKHEDKWHNLRMQKTENKKRRI